MSASIGTKIDHAFNETERALSIVGIVPVIGTVAGLSKALIGVAQLIVGVVGGIFTSTCMDNSKLTERFWTHAHHGAANIAAGLLEAIPLVGSYIGIKRFNPCGGSREIYVSTGHEDKWMPYQSLLDRDLSIEGLGFSEQEFKVAEDNFKNIIKEKPDLTYEEKLQLAEVYIKDAYKDHPAFKTSS
jgi:hypothetical protein